ncbi:MAG: phosphate signaling complex protein PhoU [Clostridium sp.]
MTRGSQALRIKEINNGLITMASLVEKQVFESVRTLQKVDVEKIDEIIKNDDKVDNLQKVIEEECIKFIATEQPLAKDLRRVFTASKIVTDLERMADHAVDICKIAKLGAGKNVNGILDEIMEMEEKVRGMISLAIKAYIERDDEEAFEICKLDDNVDLLYKGIFKEILDELKKEKDIEEYANLLFVVKYLERIGDHVTNICEWTIFTKRGTYVDLNE